MVGRVIIEWLNGLVERMDGERFNLVINRMIKKMIRGIVK